MTSSSPSASPPVASSPGEVDLSPEVGTDEAFERVLSLEGEICPFTFVRTKLALEALPLGSHLRVIVDHEPASRTIPRSATEWGQEVLGVTELGPGRWAIDLCKRVR